jgi:hypothetical protein
VKEKNMKKAYLLVAVVVLFCIVGWTVYGQKKSSASNVTYEYMVIYDPTLTGAMDVGAKKINELGAQGWELVGVSNERVVDEVGNPPQAKLFFKRATK